MTDFTTQTLLTPFNLSDHPALMQCIGFTPAGLPLCWQIVGRRHGESDILALAAAYEDRTPWRTQRAMTETAR